MFLFNLYIYRVTRFWSASLIIGNIWDLRISFQRLNFLLFCGRQILFRFIAGLRILWCILVWLNWLFLYQDFIRNPIVTHFFGIFTLMLWGSLAKTFSRFHRTRSWLPRLWFRARVFGMTRKSSPTLVTVRIRLLSLVLSISYIVLRLNTSYHISYNHRFILGAIILLKFLKLQVLSLAVW